MNPERIDNIQYEKDTQGAEVATTLFDDGPAEFLIQQLAVQMREIPEWSAIFGDSIDDYKRMDYSMRALPALRIYNDDQIKEFESWFINGDVKADIIFPASVRRDDLQQLQDTLSSALLQQFRRPLFFELMNEKVPALNELGKRFSMNKALGFEWGETIVPLTQITINFRLDLRIWDDYLEETLRTKDSPFKPVLGDLRSILTTIKGLNDDETVNVEIQSEQSTT